jgi:hypothetical protein
VPLDTTTSAGILPVVAGGIIPPGPVLESSNATTMQMPMPPGKMPDSTAGKTPAATVPGGGSANSAYRHPELAD